ncbi:MAG: thymidylate synthase, partial [Nannocystaceae bacterium]
GSLHVYEPDDERTAAVLADPAGTEPPPHGLPAMPRGDNRPAVASLMEIEEQLRLNRLRLPTDVRRLDLPPYWAQVALLFETYRRIRQHEPLTTDLVAALDPAYRCLVAHRWGSKMEAYQ